MANFDGYSIEELSRLARFIVRVKFDPPIDEKCFIDEPNRLLDGIRRAAEAFPESLFRTSVLGLFGKSIDMGDLGLVIAGAHQTFLGTETRRTVSLRALVETCIYPYVLDEQGRDYVCREAEVTGWSQS
jgi:hypothetical protein